LEISQNVFIFFPLSPNQGLYPWTALVALTQDCLIDSVPETKVRIYVHRFLAFSRSYLRSRLCYSVVSVCLSVCRLSWLNGESSKQRLLLTAYRKSYESIGTKINDTDLCLEVVYGHVNHCVTFAVEYLGDIEAWFQRIINRKWLMGNQMVTWPTTSREPERSNSWPRYA